MPEPRKGPDLVAVSLANTFQTYLPGEIDLVNSAWNDPNTVPALTYPKKYFSERRDVVPESPSLMIGMLPARQSANGAHGMAGWGNITYGFEAILIFRGDKLDILERLGRRYAHAMWETIMKHQDLDDTIPGQAGVDLLEWAAVTSRADQMTLEHQMAWTGQVYVVQSV